MIMKHLKHDTFFGKEIKAMCGLVFSIKQKRTGTSFCISREKMLTYFTNDIKTLSIQTTSIQVVVTNNYRYNKHSDLMNE